MSFAPEVVTGDFSLGKVTGPLHSGTLCSSRVPHLVASLVLCCCHTGLAFRRVLVAWSAPQRVLRDVHFSFSGVGSACRACLSVLVTAPGRALHSQADLGGGCAAGRRHVLQCHSNSLLPTAFCCISERVSLVSSLALTRQVWRGHVLYGRRFRHLPFSIRAPMPSSCHAVDRRRELLTSGGEASGTKVEWDFSLVGLTPWSLGQGLHWRLPALRLVVYPPQPKRKKPRNHTAATCKARHSVALSFKRVFFSHHPSPVHLPQKQAKTRYCRQPRCSHYCCGSSRHRCAEGLIERSLRPASFSCTTQALRLFGFDASAKTIYLSKSMAEAPTCLDRDLHGNLVLQLVLEPVVPGQRARAPCSLGYLRRRASERPRFSGSLRTVSAPTAWDVSLCPSTIFI